MPRFAGALINLGIGIYLHRSKRYVIKQYVARYRFHEKSKECFWNHRLLPIKKCKEREKERARERRERDDEARRWD